MQINNLTKSMGWHRDLPDIRDYTPEHEKIKPLLKQLNIPSAAGAASL